MDIYALRNVITRWRLKRRESQLYHNFVKNPNTVTLISLLNFITQNDRDLSITNDDFRESLLGLDWKKCCDEIEVTQREIVFKAVDDYLFSRADNASAGEWRSWIRMSRAANRVLTATEPAVARSLLNAKRRGWLNELSKDDSDYLLASYLKAYGEILERSGVDDRRFALPILLEFAAIARLLGPTEYSATILQRWIKQGHLRSRSLSSLTDEQAYEAPLRGAGSPNGSSITMYYRGEFGTPARIAFAGITGDRTLNAHMFSSLFSAALACANEQSFFTSVGGVLHLDTGRDLQASTDEGTPLRASIGVTGATEPTSGIASLGMKPDEAFELVSELFQRFKNTTGLVSVMSWGLDDVETLNTRVKAVLSGSMESTRRLKSDPGHSEAAAVVHVMPLLHRNAEGEVEGIKIPISYSALDPDLILKLIRTTRQSYMTQLIGNGRRREVMAQHAYIHQDKAVRFWQSLSEVQKDARCNASPWVTITQSYNFELGIITAVDPPERVPLREYEEKRRPHLRDSAKQYAEKFAALCATLEKLNRSGGIADTLSFRLLVDAAIRNDLHPVADEQFQSEYKKWVEHISAPVWALIEDWALRRGYPAELLAADNVLFNSKLSEDELTVWIQPHIMIDLHDFEIVIDGDGGTMYAFGGGRTTSLKERLIQNHSQGVLDLPTLREQFFHWVKTTLDISTARKVGEDDLRTKIMGDSRLAGLILLHQGQRLLFKGEIEASIDVFNKARKYDIAAIYFWGAVAHQYRFLRDYRYDLVGLDNLAESAKQERLLNAALYSLIESLKAPVLSPEEFDKRMRDVGLSRFSSRAANSEQRETQMERLLATSLMSSLPLDKDAKLFFEQLQACDSTFARELMKDQADLPSLLKTSLKLTSTEEERLSAAIHALTSLDFLALAETMKTVARSIPITGSPTRELKTKIEEIVKRQRTLPLNDPPGAPQIEELIGLLGQS